MKIKVLKLVAVLVAGVLLSGCLAGCGSDGKKATQNNNDAAAEKGNEGTVKGFYIDEETGDIIDASTGETVTDGSVKVDEETGAIVDTATGETIETKEEAEEIKQKVKENKESSKKDKDTQSDEKGNKNEKVEEEEEPQKEQASKDKNPSSEKQPANKNNSTSDKETGNKTPTSGKKVSFNKDKLYKTMVSVYKEPNYVKEPTKKEFSHEVRCQIPAKAQKLFDWYFAVMDGGQETEITVSDEEYNAFATAVSQAFNFQVIYQCRSNPDGTKTLRTQKSQIDEYVERDYKAYCKKVQDANAPAKKQYEGYLAEVKKDCDLIEKAINSMNIKGKDEVTAIKAIIDYICKNCTYGQGKAQGSHALHTGHTGEWITDCLESHKAVCNGYAKTFYAMCYYAGIDVTYYWGYTDDGEAHAWNSVKINGKDYYFDLTWQDALMESGSSKQTYVWADATSFGKEHIKKGTDITFW